jgi:hypothetical protein
MIQPASGGFFIAYKSFPSSKEMVVLEMFYPDSALDCRELQCAPRQKIGTIFERRRSGLVPWARRGVWDNLFPERAIHGHADDRLYRSKHTAQRQVKTGEQKEVVDRTSFLQVSRAPRVSNHKLY